MTLSKLKQGTSLADQPLLMGIGWLARFTKAGKIVRLSLRTHQTA